MKKLFIFLLMLTALALYVDKAQAIELVRQKNAATYIVVPLVDSADDVALQSGATSLDSEIDAWADGSAPDGFADCTNEATEIGTTGYYYLSLSQTEMNNDYIVIQIKASDINTQGILIRTIVSDPLLAAATDDGGVINVSTGAIDTVTTLTGHTAQTGDAYARLGAPAGASVSADVAAMKVDTAAILVDTSTTLDDLVDGLETTIGAAGAGLTAVPWNAAWDAEAQSEATDALNAYDPPTKAEVDTAVLNVSVDEIQATALADMFNTDSATTYASAVTGSVVKEIADNAGGSALTAGGIADAVWNEVLSEHLTGGTCGYALNAAGAAGDPWTTALPGAYGAGTAGYIIGTNLNATVSSRGTSTLTSANVWDANLSAYSGAGYAGTYVKGIFDKLPTNYIMGSSVQTAKDDEIDAILVDTGTTLDDFLDTEIAAILADTAAMDTSTELRTLLTGADTAVSTLTTSSAVGSVTAGVTVTTNNDKTGYALSSAGVQAIWDALTSALTTAGSVGKLLVDNINITLSTISGYVDTEVAAIKAKTDNLPTDPADASVVAGLIATAQADLDNPAQYKADVTGMATTANQTTIINHLTDIKGATFSVVTDSLEAISTSVANTSAPTAGEVADAVCDELLAGHTIAGSLGKKIDDLPTAGVGDWTVNEKMAIKATLGVEDDTAVPVTPESGILKSLWDRIKKIRI